MMFYLVFFIFSHSFLSLKQAFFALTSSTENDVFAHYIFMEKGLSLATAAGLPLQCSLSGVLALGAKGGVKSSFSNVSVFFSFKKVLRFSIESVPSVTIFFLLVCRFEHGGKICQHQKNVMKSLVLSRITFLVLVKRANSIPLDHSHPLQ